MKLRTFSLVVLLAGVLFLLPGIITSIVVLKIQASTSAAIGIIGGALIPTYQFTISYLMNSWWFCSILLGVALVITALFCFIFAKVVEDNCTVKTSAISLGLSAVGALVLRSAFLWHRIFAFYKVFKHPISYPIDAIIGLLCLSALIALIALYCRERKKRWSVKGCFADVFTSILYLPFFVSGVSCLYRFVELM